MAMYNENLSHRILDLLNANYPIYTRCSELALLFEHCSLRELQDIFPAVVQSVFGIGTGGLGWGLRVTTKENSPACFDMMHDFFSPMGPMLRLCYRLLNDSIKFEFNLELLPHKLTEMLQSGQYSMFYADLVNVDPFRRQVSSLSLNAFDYYILHFVIHATFPLHKMYPAALQVHNERMKTVYFFLAAGYLCTYLPSSPDSVVMPTNICATVKAPQPMPAQPLAPKRSPRYLKIPNSSLFANNSSSPTTTTVTTQADRNTESPRAHAWRTESVLHFFVDTWLRYDVDEARDLPSSEFIRVVRILVKQTHTFANSALMDHTAMVTLRKLAQPMMRSRIYPFLKSIIGRWPLDSSMSVVLELWLSYIQPWRYTYELQNNSGVGTEIPITKRFDNFIADNLVIYTQIFVHILPRFERLDFTSFRNVIMLHRLVKVFSQSTLAKKLQQVEQSYAGNSLGFDSPQRHGGFLRHNNMTYNSSSVSDWDGIFHDEVYTPMFGVSIQSEIESFIKTIYIARMWVQQEVNMIRRDMLERRNKYGFFKKLFNSLFEDVSPAEVKLQEIVKIPDILDLATRSLAIMFNVELPNIPIEQIEPRERSYSHVNFSLYDNSDYLDISRVSPMQMMNNLANLKANIDPALLPIQSHECKILVRFLHQVSCKINEICGAQMQLLWNRNDLWGKLWRQILYPPMTAQWFDKPKGVNELCEERLPARLCLRPLSSYKVLALIAFALILGQLLWHAPSFGLFSLFMLYILYLFVLALIS